MGFILIHCQIGYKSKISDKGKEAFFVLYATEHVGDVYHLYDPNTRRIKTVVTSGGWENFIPTGIQSTSLIKTKITPET